MPGNSFVKSSIKSGVHSGLTIIHLNVALATYSYVISEYSTRFPPQLHMQSTSRWCLQVHFPLICTFSSTHCAEKLISIGNCWMVIGWCKKLTRGQSADQRLGPYISCCSCQKHHNLPCFGSSNPSVAPSLGEFQYDMALKQPAVIEVPDDDFPDSGPQNPVEAQSYRGPARCHNEHIQRPLGR